MKSTTKRFDCWKCDGEGTLGTIFNLMVRCHRCRGKKYLTVGQFKAQIIQETPNNLVAIEMVTKYELNDK